MKKYYLHNGVEQEGPFTIDELKSRNLNNETPIWFDGLTNWTTIGTSEELKSIITATPPPFTPKQSALPPPFQSKKPFEEPTLHSSKKESSLGKKILTVVIIVVILLFGFFILNLIQAQKEEQNTEAGKNSEERIKNQIKNNITSYVTAERSGYTIGGFGGISNLSITVHNKTDYLIDNVKVKINYIKANGEYWDSKIINFNLMPAQSNSTINVEDTNRGTKVEYEIISIKSSALGLR